MGTFRAQEDGFKATGEDAFLIYAIERFCTIFNRLSEKIRGRQNAMVSGLKTRDWNLAQVFFRL